jgi:hypothetical protein
MRLNKLTKRALGALTAGALVAALGASAASATSAATGTNGFTQVQQTRVFDSGRIAGDALLPSGADQVINPNASKTLVPAGATAVEIQITAASETSVNGDLDVHPTAKFTPGSTSNLNYVKGVAVTSSTAAELAPDGTFRVYNHAGGAGSVRLIVDILGYYAPTAAYTPPATLTKDFGAVGSVATGGPFNSNATSVGTVDVPAGTYLVSLSFKAAGDPTFSAAHPTVGVEPNVFLYNTGKNPSFAGDVLNIGNGALPLGNHTADSYWTGTATLTLTDTTTMYLYAFGYDSDTSAGAYNLEDVSVTFTPIGGAQALS